MSKILVIGAARTGAAAAKLLLEKGQQVILTDNRPIDKIIHEFPEAKEDLEELEKANPEAFETVFGEQFDPERIDEIDYIVKSPGVPPTIPIMKAAAEKGVEVLTDLELAYRIGKADFICITGTNGKTTTTTLTGEIFRNAGIPTAVVGNIGTPVSHFVADSQDGDVFVTEISAFQLDGITDFQPKGALVLNLSPDHLDRYGVMENYVNAKRRIYLNQTEEDFLVLNQDDPLVREFALDSPVKKIFISTKDPVDEGAYYQDETLYLVKDGKTIPVVTKDELGIKGIHNVQNALGAAALSYFSGIELPVIQETLKTFQGVEHRQEYICTKNGVRYVNDSKGTNTNASIIALEAMTTPVVLLAGGYDKHEDYTDYIEAMKGRVHDLVLLGQTADDIEKRARELGFSAIHRADSFEEAFHLASKLAVPGDTVLLSPACASWGMFDNYEVRGDVFRELAQNL